MKNLRKSLLGLGFVAASSTFALHAANAMNGPTAIDIDGGPLGQLELSGGVDGYGYYLSNTPDGQKPDGMDLANALVELQKTSGILQFTIQVGANGGTAFFGTGHPSQSSISTYTTGPLRAGYITIAPPGSPVTVSVGQLGSLEGYESGVEWNNPAQLTTEMFYVENSQSRGVEASYAGGPFSGTVLFGDGYDTGVFNFLEAIGNYTINANNVATIYYGGNLGRTGTNVKSNEGPTTYQNSQMLGAFYSYTAGDLNLVPEVQYQYAKADAKIGITKPTYNFGAAVFGDYSFGTSPYSVGGWVQYFTAHSSVYDNGPGSWYIGPDNEGLAISVSPTWQYKDLFARADAGYIYLLRNKSADGVTTYGYGNGGTSHGQFVGLMEAGLLF